MMMTVHSEALDHLIFWQFCLQQYQNRLFCPFARVLSLRLTRPMYIVSGGKKDERGVVHIGWCEAVPQPKNPEIHLFHEGVNPHCLKFDGIPYRGKFLTWCKLSQFLRMIRLPQK